MNPIKRIFAIIPAFAVLLAPMTINARETGEPHECQWTQTVTVDATCTEVGYGIQVCDICRAEQEYEIPAAGHSYGETVKTEATCTEPEKETVVCTVCGDQQTTEFAPAIGHSWENWIASDRPCTEEGEKTRSCKACGATETQKTEPTEHGWGPWYEDTLPNCTAEGSDWRTCLDCGAKEFRTVAPLGHKWSEWSIITEPTCTAEGERTHTCTVCGETANEFLPAVGHTWNEWTVVTEPTYIENGERTRSCAVCGVNENETLDKLANPFTDVKPGKWYTAPILYCLQNGYMVGTTDTAFSLSQPVTRAMIAQIMAKISGADLSAPEYQKSSFVDVAQGKWYTSAIAWANANGLADGIGKGQFGYKNNITREELALFLMKLTEYNGYNTGAKGALPGAYEDLDRVHAWAYDALDWALTTGVMHGSTPKHISPRIDLTRAQIAEIIYNYCTTLTALD